MEKLHRLPAVVEMTGLGRSTIYRMMDEGDFPKPINLGARAIAWTESSLCEWLEKRKSGQS